METQPYDHFLPVEVRLCPFDPDLNWFFQDPEGLNAQIDKDVEDKNLMRLRSSCQDALGHIVDEPTVPAKAESCRNYFD